MSYVAQYTPMLPLSLRPAGHRIEAGRLTRSQKSEPGAPGSPFRRTLSGMKQDGAVLRRRHQHGVDHMDHAVGLVDVGDRHHRGAALGIDDPDLAVLLLHGQLLAFG